MASSLNRNRLSETHSPYLHQHADNPVNWQPWDEAALAAAAEHDRPIFLSVGYAACHWCHVMETESFEDETIAALLNERFVPIKVDREERPDLDRIYQTICQLVTGSGGWPLSGWLTPDGRPFFVGTYFPPTPSHGRPGFGQLLERIATSWQDDREELETRADQWQAAIRKELEPDDRAETSTPETSDTLVDAARAAVRTADRAHGGFGDQGPKFPQARRIELLLTAAFRGVEGPNKQVAIGALDAMANGGMYDQIGGGFHRYATDRAWRVPHFEKMLYDNAELPRLYLAGYQMSGRDRYARVVRETIDFLERELTHPEGGLYSTLDAQSEGREGVYYVWTPAGVSGAIEDESLASLACERFGITDGGNFEGGSSVPWIAADTAELAESFDLSTETARARIEEARRQLFAARQKRERPRRDEKILAGWNGLAVSMLAEAGIVIDSAIAERAREALGFVREHHWDNDTGRLARRYLDGSVGVDGYLDDYAALGLGAFDLHQATGDLDPLVFARELADQVLERFWDAEDRTLYFTPDGGEDLVARPQDLTDQSLPSSVGLACQLFLGLDPFVPDDRYERVVGAILETHRSRLRSGPLQHPTLAIAAARHRHGSIEITIAADSPPEQWREWIADRYLPGRILTRRPSTGTELDAWLDRLGLAEAPPIWAGRDERDGQPTAYICRDFSCSEPLTEPDEATAWLDRLAPAGTPD